MSSGMHTTEALGSYRDRRPRLQSHGSRQANRLGCRRPSRASRQRNGCLRAWSAAPLQHAARRKDGRLPCPLTTNLQPVHAYLRQCHGYHIRQGKESSSAGRHYFVIDRAILPSITALSWAAYVTSTPSDTPAVGGIFTSPTTSFSSYAHTCVPLDTNTADHHRFGQGPNWRLRTTRAALKTLGFRDNVLRHGIRREVFFCKLASNAATILRTGKGRPNLSSLFTATEVADLALDRWILPRAQRRPDFRAWRRSDVVQLLGNSIKLDPRRTASR